MIFDKSTTIAVALAASSFLTGVAANHKNLFESYVDLASNEPSAKFCDTSDLLQVGHISKLSHNKRHLDADVAAAVVSNVLAFAEKDTGAEIEKREEASSDDIAQSLYDLIQKREEAVDQETVSEVVASILSLVEKDSGAETSIGKRQISADLAAEVVAKFLGILGVKVGAGAGVKIGKREVDADATARVTASFLALSKKDTEMKKRNIDISAAAGFAANILGIFGVSAGACANLFVGWGFPSSSCGASSGSSCHTCSKKGGKRDAILDSAAVLAGLSTRGVEDPELVKKYLIELYGETEESANNLTKRGGISVDVAAQFAAHILGLLGIKVGAAAGVHVGKREVDTEDISEVITNIMELTARDDADIDVEKRKISVNAAASVLANILGLIGIKAGVGAGVKIGKRDIDNEIAGNVAAQLLDFSKKLADDIEKRNIDISAAAGVAANILGIFGISAAACANIFVGWGLPSSNCGASSGGSSGGNGGKGGKGSKSGNVYKREVDAAADAVATVLALAQRDSLAILDGEIVKKHLMALGNDEASADELIKRGGISVDVAAQFAAHILGLLGIKVGAAAGVHVGKREVDTEVAGDVLASFLGLVARDEAPVNVRAGKRSIEVSTREVIDSEVASEAIASMLSVVEKDVGAEDISKKDVIVDDDVAAKIAATIVSLSKADEGSEETDIEKRNIDISAAAGVAANILGIFGISAGACANIFVGWGFPSSSCGQASSNCKTCKGHKRELTPEVGNAVISKIFDLVEKDLGAEVGPENLKRELKELYGHNEAEAEELSKRLLSAGVAAEISAKILGLLGIKADAGASVHVKRDIFASVGHGLMKQFKTVVPQASFSVSDAAWVKDDIFKVTINFESVESAKLFDNFHEELKTLSIEGTGVYDGEELIWDGSSKSKVDNFARWSSTILVRATEKSGYHCMPEDFAIKFDWNKRPDSVLHSVWSEHFDTEYQYTLSQDFHTGEKALNVKDYKYTSQTEGQFDMESLRYWESGSTQLANFCWPAQCKSN